MGRKAITLKGGVAKFAPCEAKAFSFSALRDARATKDGSSGASVLRTSRQRWKDHANGALLSWLKHHVSGPAAALRMGRTRANSRAMASPFRRKLDAVGPIRSIIGAAWRAHPDGAEMMSLRFPALASGP